MEEKQNIDNFLLGIRCYTYNQSQYITDALNGFTMQQTTFPFVAMVVDDASTDGEQDVIAAYVEEHFDTQDSDIAYKKETDYAHITFARHKTNKDCYIVVLYLKENHYQKKPKLPYLSEWRDTTKYEALCEGDDYWIDPLKLQKQVDFLENNPEYGMCYTRAKSYSQEKEQFINTWGGPYSDFDNLLKKNVIPTLTVVAKITLKKIYIQEINPNEKKWKLGDYPMWLWFAKNSRIKMLEDVTSVYRILSDSASHSTQSMSKLLEFRLSTIDIKYFFNKKYNCNISDLQFEKDRSVLKMKTYANFRQIRLFFKEWRLLFQIDFLYAIFYYKLYLFTLMFFSNKIRKQHS